MGQVDSCNDTVQQEIICTTLWSNMK